MCFTSTTQGLANHRAIETHAARSCTIIAAGREPNVLSRIAEGEEIGTLFNPSGEPLHHGPPQQRDRGAAGLRGRGGVIHRDNLILV